MRRRTKVGIGVGVVVVLGAIGSIAVNKARNKAIEVRIETAQKRDLAAVVIGSGWVRPHRKVDVQADIMGRVTELNVVEGDTVTRGDVLLRIDPTEFEAAVRRANAAVFESQARHAQVAANLVQARREAERMHALAAAGDNLVSRQQVEDADTQVEVQTQLERAAAYGVEQAQASLGEAQDRLAKTVIRAPMNGMISRLNVDEGETAIVGTMNNAGSLLLTVADMSVMETVIRVDETDVPEIALGDSAVIEIDAFPRRKFVGRVVEIAQSSVRPPESQAATGAASGVAVDYEIVIALENPPTGLRSDLSATADIVTDTRSNVLTIPIIGLTVRERGDVEALPQEDPQAREAAERAAGFDGDEEEDIEGVFVVRGGHAMFTPVTVGIAGREYFEVLGGVAEGDSIVSGPYEVIRTLLHNAAVRQMTEDSTAGMRVGGPGGS